MSGLVSTHHPDGSSRHTLTTPRGSLEIIVPTNGETRIAICVGYSATHEEYLRDHRALWDAYEAAQSWRACPLCGRFAPDGNTCVDFPKCQPAKLQDRP